MISKEYSAWVRMKGRCFNIKNERYPNYGGRGIKVCSRWLNSFENFFADMGERPSEKHSLGRYPNVNGDYEPTNCRWETMKQQGRCTTKNVWLEYKGEKLIILDWAKRLNTSTMVIKSHLTKGDSFDTICELFLNKDYNRFIRIGGGSNSSKLSKDDVIKIRKEGVTAEDKKRLAKKYNVHITNIRKILNNQVWQTI